MNPLHTQHYFNIQEVVPLLKAYEIAKDTCKEGSKDHIYYSTKIVYLRACIENSKKMRPYVKAIDCYTTAHRVDVDKLDATQKMLHTFYVQLVDEAIIQEVNELQLKRGQKILKAQEDKFEF